MSLVPDRPDAQRAAHEQFSLQLRGVETRGFTVELRRKDDGQPIWIEIWAKPEPGGKYTRTMFLDVTDRVLMEREQARLAAENIYLREEIKSVHNFEEIVGQSPALLDVLEKVNRVAATDSTVLILGETGTGKELIARAIHSTSKRQDKPLIKINCAALPAGLVESELFGHEKGAFTGALTRRLGRFELAQGGTIFLDEIGELPPETQAKLLRVLQEREFERVGGSAPIRVDVRVLAATNRELLKAVHEKAFREDLYYRLSVFPLILPPLRDRKEDIPPLVLFLVNKFASRIGKRIEGVDKATMNRLVAYAWPGNIRELENVIERAVILANRPVLELAQDIFSPASTTVASPPEATLAGVERDHIAKVLAETQGVIDGPRGAAKILSLHPNTLRSRMKKLGIPRGPHSPRARSYHAWPATFRGCPRHIVSLRLTWDLCSTGASDLNDPNCRSLWPLCPLSFFASRAARQSRNARPWFKEKDVLKITELPGKVFKLEGDLRGPWVDESRSVCTAPLARHEQVHLDLGAVAFVDAAGAALLRELTAQGVAITQCKGFVAELLRSPTFPWTTVVQGVSTVSSEPLKGEECHHEEADLDRGRSQCGSESKLNSRGMQQDSGQLIGQDGSRQDGQDGQRQNESGQDGNRQDEGGQDGNRQDGEEIGAPPRPVGAAAEVRLEPKHPRAIRWMHWINFPVLAVMIGSGLLIYWANDVYALGPVHFFPDWFYRLLHLDHGLAVGMAYHFVFMWVFAINGACYVLYTFSSGEWRHLLPNRDTLREAWDVVLHDLKIRRPDCRAQVQWRPAAGLHRRDPDGRGLAPHGVGDL